MKVFICVLIGLVVLVLILLLLISYKFTMMVLRPNTHDTEFLLNEAYEFGRFTPDFIESLKKEDILIRSQYGYDMHGFIIDNEISKRDEYKNRVAILCHGYTSSKIVMTQYARILMDLGFTCMMYDHRNHGDNDKSVNTSMGYFERNDLKTAVDWTYERFGSDIRLLTYGESMGSAIVLSHLEIDDRPAMTIADCGYSDLTDLFRYLLKEVYHMPVWPILPIAHVMLKMWGKFDMNDVCPRNGVIKSKTPIMFIHGSKDSFVPTRMSVEMSKLGDGPRGLYLCEGAEHAQSAAFKPEEYRQKVTEFIEKYYQ